MNWYVDALRKYTVFTGRSRRMEFWFFVLFNILIATGLALIDTFAGTYDAGRQLGLFSSLYGLGVLMPSIALGVRRLHDIGRTGWWLLLVFIPVIGSIILLVFAVLDSQVGTNEYGPNPKGVEVPAS